MSLKHESVDIVGEVASAATVLGKLSGLIPMAPGLGAVLAGWRDITTAAWTPLLGLIGAGVHKDVVSGLTLSVFLAMIAINSAAARRRAPMVSATRPWDESRYNFWSLSIFSALVIIFLFGGESQPGEPPLTIWGSRALGKYGFAILVSAGYLLGEAIGGDAFRIRLIRISVLVALLTGVSLLLAWLT